MLANLPLIWKNAVRNLRRSSLTIGSIGLSVGLLALLLALYHVFFLLEMTPDAARRLIVRHRVSIMNTMPSYYVERIRQVPGVADAMIFQWFGGVYKDARDLKNFFGRLSAEGPRLFEIYPDYAIDPEQKKAFLADRAGCVVGRPLAERHGFKLGDKIVVVGDIYPVTLEFTVRGFYDKPRDNENLFFHHEYLRESLKGEQRDRVSTFGVLVNSAAEVPRVAEAIDGLFETAPDQTKSETERAFELSFLAYLGNVKMFLFAVAGALSFTMLLVSANTMAMSVRERIREVAILKTLGYTTNQVLVIVLGEAVLLAVAGGVVGLLLAGAACYALRQMPIVFADLKLIHVPPDKAVWCLAGAALVGLLAGAGPAWGAARRPVVEALRVTE
jgi:putative ABC transport system permease protein